jgi:hypothetical protein
MTREQTEETEATHSDEHPECVLIDIVSIRPNPWNPNQMKDKEFDRLVREIEESGMISPLQVVPMSDDSGTYFRIIGGEHRYNACKVLGYTTIPCVVLHGEDWQDEERQKFVTMRLNVIKGGLNPEKMLKLYEDVAKGRDAADMADMLGYTDKDVWDKTVKAFMKDVDTTGLPAKAKKEIKKQIAELANEVKTVESLSSILHKIMKKYGSTVDKNFIFFNQGGQEHIMLSVSPETWELAKIVAGLVESGDTEVDAAFGDALKVTIAKYQ